MFQLIGGALAVLAIALALGGSLLGGTLVALLTVAWVVLAQPARRAPAARSGHAPKVVTGGWRT